MFGIFNKKNEEIICFGEFVGFFAMHSIWQIENGELVIPLLATQKDNNRNIDRFSSEKYEVAASNANKAYESNQTEASYCFLAVDGNLKLKESKVDALFFEAKNSIDNSTISLAIPYRPAKDKSGIALYNPKLINSTNIKDTNIFFEDFWKGAESHTEGIKFWDKYLLKEQ